MHENLGREIEQIVVNETAALTRPDLFRKPLVAFSSASDERYLELKKTIGEWHLNPTELLHDAKSVISYFVPLTKKVVAEPKTVRDGSSLWGEAYVIINAYFEHINEAVAKYLTGLGFSAKKMPATHTYDPKDMKSTWSHKSAAAIAGLGVFGVNRILITEKGSGGRFCTLLTSAPLEAEAGKSRVENRCLHIKDGSCGLCFKICPANALVPEGIDKFACQDELNKNDAKQREITNYRADTCGKCISVCPLAYIE